MTAHNDPASLPARTPASDRATDPADALELDELTIRTVAVGPMDNRCYLLTCRGSGAQLLVDAAADPDRLLALVREGSGSARLDLVVTTHRHADHLGALAAVVAVTGASTAAGADDADAITAATDTLVHRRLHHGDVVTVGHITLAVIALRGHTPGSVSLAYREPEHTRLPGGAPGRVHLFTGDSLFPGGVGSTQGDAARFAQLIHDVNERVFDALGDNTRVYPGHGRGTTLSVERPHLDAWRARGW